MNLPNIKHAQVTTNSHGRINIVMDDGWHYYDLNDYPTAPKADEIVLSEVGYNFPTNYDFSKIIVVGEEIDEATEAEKAAAFDILMGVSE